MIGATTNPHDAEDIAHSSPVSNPVEFDGIREQAGLNSFTLTSKQWIDRTGTTAQWHGQNPGEKGNIRDQASGAQLVCLSNLENLNALFIGQALSQPERLTRLNQVAIQQMKLLTADERTPQLPEGKKGK
jgi:hypothetical protein